MRVLQKLLDLMGTYHQVCLFIVLEVFLNRAPGLVCENRNWVPCESPSIIFYGSWLLPVGFSFLLLLATSEEGFRKDTFEQIFRFSLVEKCHPQGVFTSLSFLLQLLFSNSIVLKNLWVSFVFDSSLLLVPKPHPQFFSGHASLSRFN